MSIEWRESREGGAPWLMRLYLRTALSLGRGFVNFWLWPTTAYFLLVRGAARRASRAFLSQALKRRARIRDLWRHFHTFAQVTSDRIFFLAGRRDKLRLEITGVERLGELMDQGGCLLLGSHLGSFEAARVVGEKRPDVTLRILMDRAHNATATQLLISLSPQWGEQIIDTGEEQTQVALNIGEALSRGHLVALLADRVMGGERTQPVEFLGKQAQLPITPYLIARMTSAPIMMFFALYCGRGRYQVIFEQLELPAKAPREDFVAAAAQHYANRLGHYAARNPYNWFNFYRYWR